MTSESTTAFDDPVRLEVVDEFGKSRREAVPADFTFERANERVADGGSSSSAADRVARERVALSKREWVVARLDVLSRLVFELAPMVGRAKAELLRVMSGHDLFVILV